MVCGWPAEGWLCLWPAGGLKKACCVCEEGLCLWPLPVACRRLVVSVACGRAEEGRLCLRVACRRPVVFVACGWPAEGRLCLYRAGGLKKAGFVCGLRAWPEGRGWAQEGRLCLRVG